MLALLDELDDSAGAPCGRCAVCAGPRFDGPLEPAVIERARRALRSRPVVLSVRRQTPRTADQPGKRIPPELQLQEGRALTRLGDGAWDRVIEAGRAGGRLDDQLVAACAELVAAWRPQPAPGWVTAIPSRRTGDLVPEFARRLAAALGLEYLRTVERTGDGPPQREMANSAQQVANVRGQFAVASPPRPQPGLLVDDVRYSGWTLATVGAQLRAKGAGPLYPLVLALAGA